MTRAMKKRLKQIQDGELHSLGGFGFGQRNRPLWKLEALGLIEIDICGWVSLTEEGKNYEFHP